jgi:hypothetical protein
MQSPKVWTPFFLSIVELLLLLPNMLDVNMLCFPQPQLLQLSAPSRRTLVNMDSKHIVMSTLDQILKSRLLSWNIQLISYH